jgi:hypothetical protein
MMELIGSSMKLKDANSGPPIVLGKVEQERISESIKKSAHLQASSTKAIIERPEIKDLDNFLRPTPKEAQVRDKDGNVDVAPRQVDAYQVAIQEDVRRKARNTQQIPTKVWVDGKLVSINDPTVDPIKREAATQAFQFSQPAKLTEEQLKLVHELVNLKLFGDIPELEEPGLLKRFRNWIGRKFKGESALDQRTRSYAELQEYWKELGIYDEDDDLTKGLKPKKDK